MEVLIPKYRRDPNAMVHSAYVGVVPGQRTVTRITSLNKNTGQMETTRTYGPGIMRGQSGKIATLILGGMATTLDEIEYLIQGIREKKFVRQKSGSEISKMCQALAERRNERVKYLRRNPSEVSNLPPKRRPGLFLPRGYHMAKTPIAGFRVAMQG